MDLGFKVILLLVGLGGLTSSFDLPDLNNLNRLVKANNQFAIEMFSELKVKSPDANLVFSPFSMSTIMAMLQAGAEGTTKREIEQGMHFPQNATELFVGYWEWIKHFQGRKNVTLESANRIYLKEGFSIKENFETTLKHYFKSRANQVDFGKSKKAAESINNWVADKTGQRIRNLIEPATLNNQTAMLLVNALYFKGAWHTKFFDKATKKRDFFKDEVSSTKVDMMSIEDYFPVADIDGGKAVVLPYSGKEVEMVVILPKDKNGLKGLEEGMRKGAFSLLLSQIDEKLKQKNIILNLPKFKIDSTLDMAAPLKRLKMTTLFDEDEANFEGIPEKKETLYVSKILQRAFIDVDENGSEAGAATYANIFTPLSIGPAVEEEITVDRPFMGFIRDRLSNTVLFLFRKTNFD